MKSMDKALLALFLLVIAFVLGIFIILPFGVISYDLAANVFDGIVGEYIWYYFGAAIILLVVVIRLFVALFKGNSPKTFGIVKSTENGEVIISYETIKSLVVKTINNIKGVKDSKVLILPSEGALKVLIRTYIIADANIPQAVKDIQDNVKVYIEAIAEIPVGEVKVSIIDVAPSTKLRIE